MDGFQQRTRRNVIYRRTLWLFCLLCVFLLLFSPTSGFGGPKQDKFRGKVVFAGPQAISVQSLNDIYLVRMFYYTPELKTKVEAKRPPQGKIVTIHYLRGTDTAVKID